MLLNVEESLSEKKPCINVSWFPSVKTLTMSDFQLLK